jgi:hypothetical protein
VSNQGIAMGGEMWIHWADYEGDINTVLQKAREEVFSRGEYYLAPKLPLTWLGRSIDPDAPWDPDVPPDYLEWLHLIKAAGDRPESIEELIQWNGPTGEGTRSIIDIEEVSDELYRASTTCAVPDNLLREWFGTTKPSREAVEQRISEMWDLTGRGTAVHVVVYDDDGQPEQVLFVGCSID